MESNELLFWAAVSAQFIGLVSMALTRLSEHTPKQAACQCFFFVCMAALAVATLVSLKCGSGYWFSHGTTLSVMAVGATLDMRRSPQRSVI